MRILAIETATRAGSLALLDGDACVAAGGDPGQTHGTRLPGEALAFLARHGKSLGEIDLFAVVAGPGSFTGLRVGMAAVQGLALPQARRVVPVPTLEAIAGGWLEARGSAGLLVTCLDGQRGDVFYAMYDGTGARRVDECLPVIEASVVSPESAARMIEEARSRRRVTVVGDGTFKHEAVWRGWLQDAAFEILPGTLAEAAVRIAVRRADQAVRPHALRPLYVRRPDAELARAKAGLAPSAVPADLSAFVASRITDAKDIASVEALQRRSFANAWGAEALQWELENSDVARLYVLRAPEGEPVAYCACWFLADELHINSLAVEERFRRRGLARRLLLEVIAEAVAAGVRSATLEVRESNRAARALYEGAGFRVEGVRRGYYQTPREDALILWCRDLGGQAGGGA